MKLSPANALYPPLVQQLVDARRNGALWVDASKPFWWDLPMLIAAGQIDSIELAHSHICRDTTINNEADGKPRDRQRYRLQSRRRPMVARDLFPPAGVRPADSAHRR